MSKGTINFRKMKSLNKNNGLSKFDEKQLNEIKGGLSNVSIISKQDASKDGDGKALICCSGQVKPVEK